MATATDTTTASSGQKCVDLAFAMDCTGSMASYIHNAQQNIRSISEEIVCKEKVDLRFALIEYRDHPPQDSSFVTNVLDFTSSLKEMKSRLDGCKAAGGGDTPEAVADALHALLKLSWRQSSVKVCVFIADAPPHGLGCSGDGFPNGCPCGVDPMETARKLAEKGISVYSVGCEPSINSYKEWFMAISHITSGQYVPLGSAKLLSQAIVAGTIEEISLADLMTDINNEVQKLVLDADGSINQENIEEQVYERFKGAKTKAVTSEAGSLQEPTERARLYSELPSMQEVRSQYVPLVDSAEAASHAMYSASPGAERFCMGATASVAEGRDAGVYCAVEQSLDRKQVSRMVKKSMFSSALNKK